MDSLDDSELMAQVKAGHGEAPLVLLFERHHGPLYGFLYRITGHVGTSEDLVQDVFLRVLRYADSFKSDAPFRPWLYRIARNVLADHWARHRPEVPLELYTTPLEADRECAHAQLEAAQDHQRLNEALKRMSLEKRELLLLSRDPELSYADLAVTYGCSISALKVRVHRALQELRSHFFQPMEVR